MCDQHSFEFDVDKAYADQLVEVLETSPLHPLQEPEAPKAIGVYALYRSGEVTPVYIGQALNKLEGIRGRLRDHLNKIRGRRGISMAEMTCRYLTISREWEIARAEDALIARYNPPWNKIRGFGPHDPGKGRPGMPGYVSPWDQLFPPLDGTP
jgi:hypothetical protein